jgi:hypothetical protein
LPAECQLGEYLAVFEAVFKVHSPTLAKLQLDKQKVEQQVDSSHHAGKV